MTEKEQRIYYQDIVYTVCNALDRIDGGVIVCGTAAQPSTQVQERMERLVMNLLPWERMATLQVTATDKQQVADILKFVSIGAEVMSPEAKIMLVIEFTRMFKDTIELAKRRTHGSVSERTGPSPSGHPGPTEVDPGMVRERPGG